MKSKKATATVGRPRAFDVDEALDRALEVFWRRGYEGTSLTDLTGALGINRPSLYAAFGNKEELFKKALDRYVARGAAFRDAALAEPKIKDALDKFMRGMADALSDPKRPRGCLTVQGALACSDESAGVRETLCDRRAATEAAIKKRISRAISEKELSAEVDAGALASFFATVGHGMSVQASSGASRAELRRIADMSLRVLE
jgi:AcrR family transcriptional regulator